MMNRGEDGVVPDRQRWINLGIVCLAQILQGYVWLTYAPVSPFIATTFSVGVFEVSTLASNWVIMNVVFFIPVMVFLPRFGLRSTVLVSTVSLALSSILRMLGSMFLQFWIMWLGQLASSLCMASIVHILPVLSRSWSGTRFRPIAMGIGALVGIVGNTLALLTVPFIVTNTFNMNALHITQTLISCIAFIVAAKFFANTPQIHLMTPSEPQLSPVFNQKRTSEMYSIPIYSTRLGSPPSPIVTPPPMQKDITPLRELMHDAKLLATDPHCIVLWLTFTLECSVCATLCVVMCQQLPRFTQQETGIFAGVMLLSGTICTLVLCPVVQQFGCHKMAFVGTTMASCIGGVGYVTIEYLQLEGWVGILCTVVASLMIGAGALANISMGMSLTVKIARVIREDAVVTILHVSGYPIMYAFIVAAVLCSAQTTFIMLLCVCIVAFGLSLAAPKTHRHLGTNTTVVEGGGREQTSSI